MQALAAQPERLAELGRRGRQAWEAKFSWDKIFRAYEKVFCECLRQAKDEAAKNPDRPIQAGIDLRSD
jgi:hypothetical protein